MVTRRAQEIRGTRSYWDPGRQGGASSTKKNEPLIRIKIVPSGAVMETPPFTGAVEVIRRRATVDGGIKGVMVICRRDSTGEALRQFRVGVPISVIDPGLRHSLFILPDGEESSPIIAKAMCRPLKKCADANGDCGNCCNKPRTTT